VFAPPLPRDTAQGELVLAHTDHIVKHRRLATPEPELGSRDYTMRRTQLLCGAALLALCTQTLSAQQTRTSVPLLGFSVGTMSMDAASAALSQVGDRSYGLQLDAGALIKQHLYLGIDIGGQFLKDNAQFTQNTTGGVMKSSASVTYFSAIAGLRSGMPRAVPIALALNVGGSVTLSRRSIDNCEDCQVDKLKIPGGAFVEPALIVGSGRAQFRASNRIYGGCGMRNVTSVGMELALAKWR